MNPVEAKPCCHFCGKALAKDTLSWWEGYDKEPEPVVGELWKGKRVLQILKVKGDPGKRRFTFWCGHLGYRGNGRFCSKECGWCWAVGEEAAELLKHANARA